MRYSIHSAKFLGLIMKHHHFSAVVCTLLLLAGCANRAERLSPQQLQSSDGLWLKKNVLGPAYPDVEYTTLMVPRGSQTITAANKLADELGIEFVEWDNRLNPYAYKQQRSENIRLNFDDPQSSFLQLFERSGLLPLYKSDINTITIYPFSAKELIDKPTIFTPMFTRSAIQRDRIQTERTKQIAAEEHWHQYYYYRGFTIKDTIDAWAKHAGYSSVVWYVNDPRTTQFLFNKVDKEDSCIGKQPIDVIRKFITDQKNIHLDNDIVLSAVVEPKTNRLLMIPYAENEAVQSFNVEATNVKSNLKRAAQTYGYTILYNATNYDVPIPYVTVLSRFVHTSISDLIQQYPLDIEVIDSSKIIKITNRDMPNETK